MYNREKEVKIMILLTHRLQNSRSLSASEKKIAGFVLDHPQRVVQMSSHELAEATFTSSSTITRLCRKMKTEGFGDFKIQLARELSSLNLQSKRIADNVPFTKNQTPDEIMNSILNLNYQALNDTYNNLDKVQLQRVATMLYQAPHIYLYGVGQSLILCQDFQYKLFRIRKDVNLETHAGFQLMKTTTQPEDSIALIISYYGTSSSNLRIVQSLYENRIPYILITGPNLNPLCVYAKEIIHVPPQEELIHKVASFSSRTAIQLVLDFIYSLIFAIDYERNQSYVMNEDPIQNNPK